MNRVHASLLICICCLLAAGCKTRAVYKPADPIKLGKVPDTARLVAEASDEHSPLLFIPSADGNVYYIANDDLLATFQVKNGQRVELNAWTVPVSTEIQVDGKAVFKSRSRTRHHRFYFQPR